MVKSGLEFIILKFTKHLLEEFQNRNSRQLFTNIFELKVGVKRGLEFFEILLAPSEVPANLPGQFSLSGQIFLHWAAATLKGLVGFQNKKNLDHFSPPLLAQKCWFYDLRF